MFKIIIYEDVHGKSEVSSYIESLKSDTSKDGRIKAKKIAIYMRLLKAEGFNLREPYIKKLDGKIWELRPLNERFLFAGYIDDEIVILTHFTKKTNKTPIQELEKAKRYFDDYIKRRGL